VTGAFGATPALPAAGVITSVPAAALLDPDADGDEELVPPAARSPANRAFVDALQAPRNSTPEAARAATMGRDKGRLPMVMCSSLTGLGGSR
jgi:hypothetical protein